MAWQRWELEVVHRDLKTGLGLGDKQTFHPHAAVASVEGSAWGYANLMLVGYRTWGAAKTVPRQDAWRQHQSRRGTLMGLIERFRVELTTRDPFRRLFARSTHNWFEMEQLLSQHALPPPFSATFNP